MIYTVTFNPSLDYVLRVENFTPGRVNRAGYEKVMCGGKGVNVSIVLRNLGVESTALGFAAGFTGEEILRRLRALFCREDFLIVDNGCSRINIKLKSDEETEINGQGPALSQDDFERLQEKLDGLADGDILVLAGSIPDSLPQDTYEKIMERLRDKEVRIVVDATKELLLRVLKYRPFLVKPNSHELGEMFGVVLAGREEILLYARRLRERGARNVLVSLAGEGAVLLDEDGNEYESPAPEGRVVNSVGAGDSMVAGFLAGYLKSGSYETALKTGIAAGSASAFSEELATGPEVEALLNAMEARR